MDTRLHYWRRLVPSLLALLAVLGSVLALPGSPVRAGSSPDSTSQPARGVSLRFSDPSSVAADTHGNVYVFDRGTWSIDKLTADGTLVATWPISMSHTFPGPGTLTVDGAGNVYVLLGNSRRGGVNVGGIAKLSSTGKVLALWYGVALLNAQSLAAGKDGSLFILVLGQSKAGNPSTTLVKLSSRGRTIPTPQLINYWYDFTSPLGIATDSHGRPYVTMAAGSCQRGCQGGTADLLEWFASAGKKPVMGWHYRTYGYGELVGPGLALDGTNTMYVAGASWITKLSPNTLDNRGGKIVGRWGALAGCGPLRFRGIAGIALGAGNTLYVVDEGDKNVQKISTHGQPEAIWGGCPSTTPPTPILPTPKPV